MALKQEDFTEEQWAAIVAETDRRAHDAAETARKKALKAAEDAAQERIDAAVADERARLEADEQGRIEIEKKKLDEIRQTIEAERKSLAATKKLLAAGFNDSEVETLLPMFVGVDDKNLDSAIETFVGATENLVKAQIDAVKQELLNNATPPTNPTGGPTDAATAALELASKGDDVGAIDALLTDAGMTT